MKRKILVLLALMLLVCSVFFVPVQAETVLQDGIEVTLTTDKERYDALETIYAKLTVKNTNSFDVANVTTKITAPAGYLISGGEEANIGVLSAGEEYQQQVTMRDTEAPAPVLPQTGDDSHGALWSALFVVAVAALCALIRNPQAKRLVSIFLCVAIVGPYVMQAESVWAEDAVEEHIITVEKEVLVDGNSVPLVGSVVYGMPMVSRFTLRAVGETPASDLIYTISGSAQDNAYAIVKGYRGTSSSLVIPSYIEGKPVKIIGDGNRFEMKDPSQLETLVLPDTVVSIRGYAFNGFTNLSSVQFPYGSLKEIGGMAFTGTGITEVDIYSSEDLAISPQVVENGGTFGNCDSLQHVNIVCDGFLSFAMPWIFQYCDALETVNLSAKGRLFMHEYAFANCPNLYDVKLDAGDSVEIRNYAFQSTGLNFVSLPKVPTIIGDEVFADCRALGELTLLSNVTSIGPYAFLMCGFGLGGLTIKGEAGSYVETYVREYNQRHGHKEGDEGYITFEVIGGIPAQKLAITMQPQDKTVSAGKLAVFTIGATGTGLKYQWYYRNAGKTTWTKGSSTTNTYAFTMKESSDAREIRCKVTDASGKTITSETVKVKLPVVKIITQPESTWAYKDENATISLVATGNGLKYQWYYSTDGGKSYKKSSGTQPTFSLTMNKDRDGRKMYCKVSDAYGNSVKSKAVTLDCRTMLKITTQPESVKVVSGDSATATVKATGDGLKYQWYYLNPGMSTFEKSSAKQAKTSVTMTEARNGRQMYCIVSDEYGNQLQSKTITMTMADAVKIVTQPVKQTVSAGDKATFSIEAVGDGLQYQWYYRNAGKTTWTKGSSTESTYSFTMKESSDGREVRCKVTDAYGKTVTSNAVKVTLPVVKIVTQPLDQSVSAGDKAIFSIEAVGDGLQYQWYYRNAGKTTWTKGSSTESTYSFTMKESSDGREVRCKVTDAYGKTVTSDTVTSTLIEDILQLIPELDMSRAKLNKTTYALGETITISGIRVVNADVVRFSGNNSSIATKEVQVTNSRQYTTLSDVTFTLPSNAAAGSFYIDVEARNSRASSIYDTAFTYTVVANNAPSKPTGVTALKESSSSIGVTWTKVTGATGYYVYRSTSSGSGYSKVKTITSGSTVSYMDTGLSAYTRYYYKVSAYNASGESEWSSYSSARTDEESAVPTLDMSNAKLNKSTYAPGETIKISGIRVINADTVRFSGNNSSIATKEVQVTNSSEYTTLSDVTFTLPSNAVAGSFYIDVEARNERAASLYDTAFTYTIAGGMSASEFEYIIENGCATVTDYTGSLENVVIPNEIDGYRVAALGKSLFVWSNLSSVTIPDSVISIGDAAFYGCNNLTSIDIPDSVKSIGYNAFVDCNKLKSIKIPEGVESIDANTFHSCSSLTSVDIPDSVTSIANHVFYECSSLASIDIPDSVTSIGEFAFYGCSSLKNIKLSNSVTSIGDGVFEQCSSLNTIVIPNSVTSMGYPFGECDGLTAIYIPQSVGSIGWGAFADCLNLTIYGVAGSYAQNYAAENNIPFIASTIPGISNKL